MRHLLAWLASLATLASLASGCGGAGAGAPPLLAPPGDGMQLALSTSAPAGTEARLCQLFVVHAPILLGRLESRTTAGIHHLAIGLTDLAPEAARAAPFDCAAHPVASQTLYAANETAQQLTFASGATLPLAAGQVLVVELHVLNATPSARTLEVAVNLVAGDASGPRMDLFRLPSSTTRATCRATRGRFIQVLGGSALHAMTVTLIGPELSSPVPLFANEPPEPLVFRPALRIDAGDELQLSCDDSPAGCSLVGTYFPADANGLASCQAN